MVSFVRLSGVAHLLAVLALLLGYGLGQKLCFDLCVAATVIATLLRWSDLPKLARAFVLGGIVSFFVVAQIYPGQQEVLLKALVQGAAFSCLLATLGLLRYPVRRSGVIRAAAAYLLSFPHKKRYTAVNAGCHFLSLLFNVGIIPLLGDLLAKEREAMAAAHERSMLLAAMRGAVLMTVWSPMGLGFAIVTTSIPALDPVLFIAWAFGVSMLMMIATCFTEKIDFNLASHDRPGGREQASAKPLLLVLMVCVGLMAAVIAIHQWLNWSFIAATVLVLPVFSAAWLLTENRRTLGSLPEVIAGLMHCIGDMRAESAIFLSANVIGAALALLIREQSLWQVLQASSLPMLAVLMLCLVIVPLAGALFIPHSIFVVLTAQLFGNSPLGQNHPLTLGLALTLGWAMAIAISPISAMALMTGKLCGAKSYVVGFDWNRRFVTTVFGLSSLVIAALYSAGL